MLIRAAQIAQTNLTHPAIDANTNRFQSGQGYAFDKNGNLTTDPADGGRSFVFNGDNKQKEVRGPSNELIGEYFYDGEGRRVKKHRYVGGVLTEVTVFVYSAGKLAAEYSTAPPEQNPTTKWTVTDQLGSPRVLVDSLGQVVSRRDFMPFGEEITPDGTHRNADLKYNFGDNIRQKFTGYQKDEETQLDFAEARMYQNLHGRFTAVDPLLASGKSGNPQTFNRYVYVINNPLIFVDPDGLQVGKQYGRVFRKGGTFRIYSDDQPESGFEPVAGTINTTTTIRGVEHHWQVRPNGWTVGDRVDGARFESQAPTATQTRSDISAMAGVVNQGVYYGFTGIAKGAGNAPFVAFNGITGTLLNHAGGSLIFGGSNPLEVPLPFTASNAFQADYMGAATNGALFGAGGAAGAFRAARTGTLSVVPQEISAASSSRFWAPTNFGGTKVYQRNDLFDPNLVSSWTDKGSVFSGTNVQRMASGRAPIGIDGESVVLHHLLQIQKSPLAEMSTTFHRTNSRIIHINPNSFGSGINRSAFDAFRSRYWTERASSFR